MAHTNEKKKRRNPRRVMVVRATKNLAAESTRSNIMVIAQCVPRAIEASFCAIFTRACIFKGNKPGSPAYWAYYAYMDDIRQIMGSEIPASGARLKYLNTILAAYIPKAVPFKADSELVFSWGNVGSIVTAPSISIRGYNYYMYVNGGSYAGIWEEQVAPSTPSSANLAFDKLSQVYTQVAAKTPGLELDSKDSTLSEKYKLDVSGYAVGVPYYGQATGENGPCYSCESEIKFKAPLLSGIAVYDRTRVARKFNLNAGDPCATFGYPFLPNFNDKFFDTKIPPIFKFIDVDEFIYLTQVWYSKMVSAFANTVLTNPSSINDDVLYALSSFKISPEAYRVYWRQIFLNMFAASQACAQFMTYSTDASGFEPLRVGSNCYPPNITGIQLPEIIVENIRMLQTKIYTQGNSSDALMMIPVLGVYKSVENFPYNIEAIFYEGYEGSAPFPVYGSICAGTNKDGIYPRIIDCSGTNNVPLFVNGSNLTEFIADWNFRYNILKAASLKSGILEGSSTGSLLNLTRYCRYNDNAINVSKLPHYMTRHFPKSMLEERTVVSKNIKRTNSIKDPKEPEKTETYFVPKQFDLYTQTTGAISSLYPISETVKTLCQYMVLPTLFIEADNTPPLQRQVRVQNLEGYVWDWEEDSENGYASQALRLDNFAAICAPGLAANSIDELSELVSHMNTTGQGGFLGDVLKGVVDFFGW